MATKKEFLEELRENLESAMALSEYWLSFSNRELKDFLFHNMYQHYRVMRMSAKADMILSRLFDTFLSNPKLMPTHIQESIDEKGLEVAICDYIAGMTDRYATEQYKKLFDPDTLPEEEVEFRDPGI